MSTITEYLDKKGMEHTVSGHEATANCPFCGDTERKFSINVASGAWRCFHQNRCGRTGSFWTLQKELGDEPQGLREGVKRARPTEYRRPGKASGKRAGARIMKWFAKRAIKAETVAQFRIGMISEDEMSFPYYKDGQLVNLKYRKLPKTFRQEKDCEPCLFGRDQVTARDVLLITEGELDAMAMYQYGLPAVSVPSGASDLRWIEGEWNFLSEFKRIAFILDQDQAGGKGVEKIVKRLGWKWGLSRVVLPFKDPNECLMQGVTRDEVITFCFQEAVDLAPPEVKALRDIPLEECTEPEPGVPIGIPGLQELLHGWRAGEVTVHGGDAGSGKTTMSCQIAVDLLVRNQRVCMASLEMPMKALISWMVRQAGMVTEAFIQAFGDRLFFVDLVGEVDVDRLLDLWTYCTARHDVDHFVLDSLGRISISLTDYWLRQKLAMNKLVDFAKTNWVHSHVVHHTRKPAAGGSRGRPELEGSAWIRNLADNVILYRRIREEDREEARGKAGGSLWKGVDQVLRLDKNRSTGDEGQVVLRFDKATKRFERVLKVVQEEKGRAG